MSQRSAYTAIKAQLQRSQLAVDDRSHSCRNLDCDRPAGHVGLLPSRALQRIAARHSRAGPVLGFHIHHRVLLSDLSKRILVSRERAAAAIDPHGLAALARAVVGHAGGAPGRSRDLAALASGCLRQTAAFACSRLSRSYRE